ncbi:MAG: competence/damage-inducible protein A [Bdellovibrionaceae bacterium]|nr:competence/damage-inducible protein A [Pseudobdellovibrionaceae bacterium]
MSRRPRAAILAIGTEVTDGQVIDRNSAWISTRLVRLGVEVVEHRAVPDERQAMRGALREMRACTDLLFVTGGLGPTSDDFTREVISEVLSRPLEFDPASWKTISERLAARGVPVRESQKKQCEFPQGAEILLNAVGTAHGFLLREGAHETYVLPGPPLEIAAVWEAGIETRLNRAVAEEDREDLRVYRCMGKGESELADMTEEIMKNSGLRLGYRAHVPYVEIKVWVPRRDRSRVAPQLDALEAELAPWLVNRDDQDLAEDVLTRVESGHSLEILDRGTMGWMVERLATRVRDTRRGGAELALRVVQDFASVEDAGTWLKSGLASPALGETRLLLVADTAAKVWRVAVQTAKGSVTEEYPAPFRQPIASERSRKFIVEQALRFLLAHGWADQVGASKE